MAGLFDCSIVGWLDCWIVGCGEAWLPAPIKQLSHPAIEPSKRKPSLGIRTASNDCLPYEKSCAVYLQAGGYTVGKLFF
jgi:hypothetical protein